MGHNDIMEAPYLQQFQAAVTEFLHSLGLPPRRGARTRALIPDFDGLVRTKTKTGKQIFDGWNKQREREHLEGLGALLKSVTDERSHITDEDCLDPDVVYAQVRWLGAELVILVMSAGWVVVWIGVGNEMYHNYPVTSEWWWLQSERLISKIQILFDMIDVTGNHLVGVDELRWLLKAINIECARLGLDAVNQQGIHPPHPGGESNSWTDAVLCCIGDYARIRRDEEILLQDFSNSDIDSSGRLNFHEFCEMVLTSRMFGLPVHPCVMIQVRMIVAAGALESPLLLFE